MCVIQPTVSMVQQKGNTSNHTGMPSPRTLRSLTSHECQVSSTAFSLSRSEGLYLLHGDGRVQPHSALADAQVAHDAPDMHAPIVHGYTTGRRLVCTSREALWLKSLRIYAQHEPSNV